MELQTVTSIKTHQKLFGETPKRTRGTRALPKNLPLLAFLLTFHLPLLNTHAQETVIIPYDATKPIATQKPDQRYVPYERFMQLWDAAKSHKRGPVPPEAPDKYLLDNARYEAVLDGKMMRITATLDLHTFGDKWVEVPIQFRQRQWSDVTLDGAPAPYLNDRLLINKPGAHRVVLTSSEPFLSDQRRNWSMPIPKAGATTVVITLPGTGGTVSFEGEHPSTERIENGRKIISTVLGTTNRLAVNFDLQTIAVAPLTEPDSAVVRNQIITRLGWERIVTRAEFDLAGSTLDHFSLLLPADCQPVDLNGTDIRTWKLTASPEGQRLDVSLTAAAKKSYTLELITERPLVAGSHAAPVITALARRVENRVELIAGPGMEFLNVQPGEARQIASEQPVDGLFAAYSLIKSGGTITYEVKVAEIKREAKISTVYQVSRRKIEVIASLTLGGGDALVAGSASGAPAASFRKGVPTLVAATIPIPADFDIETVQSGNLRDWWREGNVLHLRFNPTTGAIPLVLYLVKQFDAAPAGLDIFPIRPDGFQTVTGEAVIAAHMGDDATLTLTGTAKQVAPETTAKDFSILAPLERKRAFTYTKADFSGKVNLSSLPLKLAAAWVTHVQAHEGWLAWQTKATMVVRQGSTRTVSFSLSADLPEARVSGPEVRETSSKIDPKNPKHRIYEVALQNDLVSATDLTIDLEQSAGLPVAALEFANLEREDGYLAAENVSDYEMSLQPKNLDVAQASDLPFLPPLTTGASLYRLRPGWSLGVTLQRLEKTGLRAAFVAWAEMTTAIREDGTEWNRIVWHLQNRSLQFLPVRLPVGGELVGARVAGENVRADVGVVDGQKVTLIPLIKTRTGDISYDVEMIWRRSGLRNLGWLSGRSLDDPDLVGVTVERTLWNLYLPKNHPLTGDPDRVGNMDAVIAEVNRTEKLSGMLDELKSLNSVVLSRKESSYAKVQAKENFDRLAKDLEKETAQKPQDRSDYENQPANRRKRALKQQADVSDVQSQLKASVADEKKKQAEEAVAAAPAQPLEQQVARQQSWDNNGAYANNSNAVVARKLEVKPVAQAGQNQLLLNDGVVLNNATAANIDAYSDASKVTRSATLRKGDDTVSSKPTFLGTNTEGASMAGEGTLTIDSDDLRVPQSTDAKNAENTDKRVFMGRDEMVETEKLKTGKALADTQEIQTKNQIVLGSARGNKYNSTIASDSQNLRAAVAQAAATPASSNAMAPAASMTFEGPRPRRVGGFAGKKPSMATASLGVKGRVSLNADFPLEGQVWHFKKLKANARLDFRVGSKPLVERWQHIGWFALAAAILGGLGRLGKAGAPRFQFGGVTPARSE